jgi:hypothetical protein
VVVTGWQGSPILEDAGLAPNAAYCYRVQAKDSSPDGRTSDWTAVVSGRTLAALPAAPVLGEATQTTVQLTALGADGNPTDTQYAVFNATTQAFLAADGAAAEEPVWRTAADWAGTAMTGLAGDTEYSIQATSRNADGVESILGPCATVRTLREGDAPRLTSLQIVQHDGSIVMEFSEAVVISIKDLLVTDSGGASVDLADAALDHIPGGSAATLRFIERPQAGYYAVTLRGAQVQDLAANLLDGDGDGEPGGDYQAWVMVPYLGDATLDGSVDAMDYLTLKCNFGTGAAWGQGDFNGDGKVDGSDLLLMEGNFGLSLGQFPADAPEPAAPEALAVPTAEVLSGSLAKSFARPGAADVADVLACSASPRRPGPMAAPWSALPLPPPRPAGRIRPAAMSPLPTGKSDSPGRWTGDVLQQAATIRSEDASGRDARNEPWAARLAVEITDSPRKGRLAHIGLDLLATWK